MAQKYFYSSEAHRALLQRGGSYNWLAMVLGAVRALVGTEGIRLSPLRSPWWGTDVVEPTTFDFWCGYSLLRRPGILIKVLKFKSTVGATVAPPSRANLGAAFTIRESPGRKTEANNSIVTDGVKKPAVFEFF